MRPKVLLVTACLLSSAAAAHAQVEGFDNITTLPGSGWFLINHSEPIGVTNWFQGEPTVFPAQAGPTNSYIAANFRNGGGLATISNWLLAPAVTLVNGATLNFWTRRTGSTFPDRLQVRMSTAGAGSDVGTSATDVGTFTALLLDINPNYTPTGYPAVWTQFNVTVTGVPTPTLGRMAFRYFVENSGPLGANGDYIGIDTVGYTGPPVMAESLAVDAAGNRVLQPNEAAVVVAPTWRNTSFGLIASLTGVLSDFAGPVGATYTIDDSAASYGSIAAGASANCGSNCYAVTVTTTTRPAVHWDATALETVSAGPTTRTWTLHVGDSFSDVPASNPFYRFVETLLHKGVTGGCSPTTYCPGASTTREQMAVFVLVAREPAGFVPPACTPPNLFLDVPDTSPFCRWIEELANRGVVSGCGAGNYCPAAAVNREQISVFVLRTLDPALNPPACVPPNIYSDVPETNTFCRWIEELTNRAVVSGCGGGNYCPTDPVTREQIGVFLTVTFSLELYGL